MSEGTLLVLSLVVSGLTLLGFLALGIFLYRMHRAPTSGQNSHLSRIAEDQRRLVRWIRPFFASGRPLESVITRLSFTESLDPDRFALVSEECALGHINSMLVSGSGDGVVLTVNTLRLTPSGAEMTVSASRKGKILLRQGKAVIPRHGQSRRALPILKDARTGKFIETMQGVPAAKALSRLGAMSSAVVGAAHIVAGADIAKRLKQINSNMNLLLAYRRIDQMAKVETIYTSAKELGSGPMDRDKCWELWRLRGELRQLRCSWRRELQHHLDLIGDRKAKSWFTRMFARQKTSDRDIHGRITEGQLQLGMIEYSMRLGQALAIGGGMMREFEGTLADELSELQAVANLLQDKASLISGKDPDLSVEPTVTGMTALVEQYKGLLPDDSASAKDQVLLPPPEAEEAEV